MHSVTGNGVRISLLNCPDHSAITDLEGFTSFCGHGHVFRTNLRFLRCGDSWLRIKWLPLLHIPGGGSGETDAQIIRVAQVQGDVLGQDENDTHPEAPVTLNHGGGYNS